MYSIIKKLFLISIMLMTGACSTEKMEEFVFKKTLELSLQELCDGDEACDKALEEQITPCMEKSDWRAFLNNEDDEEELSRFTREFYSCIVDEEGKPYFESTV